MTNSADQKLPNRYRGISPLNVLAYSLVAVSAIGFGLALWSFIETGRHGHIFSLQICMSNSCVEYFVDKFSQSLAIARSTLDLLVAIATTGGIVVALLSYLNSSSTAALTNHIAHFSIFQNYVINEISKRKRISHESIDLLVWYNFIFSTSRSGKTDVSASYITFIRKLNDLIDASNAKAERAIDGSFRYKHHQEGIQRHLRNAGIEIQFCPRNDFFEMEGQIFSIIDRINQSFCYSSEVPTLHQRKYI